MGKFFDYDLAIAGGGPIARRIAHLALSLGLRTFWGDDGDPGWGELLPRLLLHQKPGEDLKERIDRLLAQLEKEHSPTALQRRGLDWTTGSPTWDDRHLVLGGRSIVAKHYLAIQENQGDGGALWTQWADLPREITLPSPCLGAIEWAQALQRHGHRVTLMGPLLPQEEPEARQLMEAGLQNQGIRLLPAASLDRSPGIAAFDPPALTPLPPQVGICGSGRGGYRRSSLTLYEAQQWVRHLAQGKPTPPPWHYQTVPWSLVGVCPLARVGWTAAQAKRHYGSSPDRITTSLCLGKNTAHYWITGTPIVWGKLVWCDQRLIGATLIAPQAEEMIHTLALAIRQGLTQTTWEESWAIGESSHALLA